VFAKINPRTLFFIVLGICLLGILSWYFAYFSPRQAEITAARENLDNLNSQIAVYTAAQQSLPGLRRDVAALQTQRDVFLQALPRSASLGSVLRDLRQDVQTAGGDLGSLNVATSSAAGLPAGVNAITLNLTVTGRFTPTFQVIRAAETMNRFSTISSLALTLPQPDSTDPTLNTTMGLTVYTFDPGLLAPTTATPTAPPAPSTGGGVQ
jgi:type IV pilus assembly protein PilO